MNSKIVELQKTVITLNQNPQESAWGLKKLFVFKAREDNSTNTKNNNI